MNIKLQPLEDEFAILPCLAVSWHYVFSKKKTFYDVRFAWLKWLLTTTNVIDAINSR